MEKTHRNGFSVWYLTVRMKTNSKFTAVINKNVPKLIGSCEVWVDSVFMSLVFNHN